MKKVTRALIIVVSAGMGLAAGSLWRAHSSGNMFDFLADADTGETGAATNNAPDTRKGHAAGARTNGFADKLAAASPVERWLYWMSELEKAKPEDYPRLARMARGNPAVWRFVVKRWIQVSPKSLFDTIAAEAKNGATDLPLQDLTRQLLTQWAKDDPKAVIAALNEGDAAPLQAYRTTVAGEVVNSDPELGLQLLHDWHIENYSPWMDAIARWADANPQHAAAFALQYPAGYASQTALETIGTEWAKTDPGAALAFATSQMSDLATHLASAAMKQWATQDLQAAGQWLSDSDDQTRNQLSPAFIETWAKQDAQAALAWSESNLQGIQLEQAVTGVMNGATSKDANAAAALVTAMDPGEARTDAAGVVAQKLFPMFPNTGSIPSSTTDWIAGLDPSSIESVLNHVTWNWASADPGGMAKFLTSLSPDEIPQYTDSAVMGNWVRSDPVDAMNWAATLPGTQALSVGESGFSQWQSSQPDAAAAWLNGLSMDDPRRAAFAKK